MATYVVGDIHGCFREWIQFKSKIERQDAEAEFLLVGDILDKGPHSFEMLKWAMEKIIPGSRYQMVLGNHEAEKIEWLKYVLNNTEEELWKEQNIARKMLSSDGYEFYKICYEKNFNSLQLHEILNWLDLLPNSIYREIETAKGIQNFLITHHKQPANVVTEYSKQQPANVGMECIEQHPRKTVMNSCKMKKKTEETKKVIVIHGHIPTTLEPCKRAGAVPGKIWIQEREINVDCGLVYGISKKQGLYGDLAAIRLEDFQEFYYYNHSLQ